MSEIGRRNPHPRFLLILLGLGIVIFWLPQLPSSFWLDETITAWVVDGSFGEMLRRSLEFQPMAPTYYIVAWLAHLIGGTNEIILRLPSVTAMGFSAYLLYRLGRRMFDAETGLLALIILATSSAGAHAATDARPYALATLALVAATLSLVRWFQEGRIRDGVAYVLLAPLVVYTQYVVAPALLAHVAYAWHHRRDGKRWSFAVGGMAVLFFPLLPHLLRTLGRRDVLSLDAGTPADLLLSVAPPALLIGIAGGIVIAAREVQLEPGAPGLRAADLSLLWAWAIAPPLTLFAVSRLLHAGVFSLIHLTPSMPAVATLAALGIRQVGPPKVRRLIVTCVVISSLLLAGTLAHSAENWRGAIDHSNKLIDSASFPVLVRPMLVESRSTGWLLDQDRIPYLLAPVQAYPTAGRVVPLPYELSAGEQRYLETTVVPIAAAAPRFLVISLTYEDPVLPWLQGRLQSEGFELAGRRVFGVVVVALFQRS